LTTNQHNQFERLVQKFAPQSKLLRSWELKGGVSAQVTALEIERPGGPIAKMIVRQHGPVDLEHNPQIAADEFKLLQLLQSAGLATPTPYGFDQSGEIFATPYIVIEYVDGQPEFAPSDINKATAQLAAHLASVHAIECTKADLSFLPSQEDIYARKLQDQPAQLDEILDEGRIRNTLEESWPLPQRNAPVLLHGDFWPGNVLWKNGELVAVIDWEDAKTGDPLADLANSRLEILWAFGIDAMQLFTEQYKSSTAIDFTDLPYWDLWAALRPAGKLSEWAGDEETAQVMREKHRLFLSRAYAELA